MQKSAAMMPRTRLIAWMLTMLVGWAIGERVLAQSSPPTGLQPGEVLVRLGFSTSAESKPGPPNIEGSLTTERGRFAVEATFAAKYVAPAPGKRTLSQFRLLAPDGISGELEETRSFVRLYRAGEGGIFPDLVWRTESWKAKGVPVSLPQFDIEIDVDAKTWVVREFGDDPRGWFGELTKAQSYSGLQDDYDDTSDGKKRVRPIVLPRMPTLNTTALTLAEPGFGKLGNPLALDSTEGTLSGSSRGVGNSLDTAELTGTWTFDWSIRDSSPGLELRVTAKGYANWLPTVKSYDPETKFIDPGSPLSLVAQVVDPSGKIPAVLIKELRWKLHETSELPGLAMNYPYRSAETSWDLSLAKRLATSDKKQEVVEENLTTLKSSMNVYPWDWGGWSTLRVEATLDDGMKLQGKIKGPDGDETDIRLPDRTSDSKIQRKWKTDNVGLKEPDNLDENKWITGKTSSFGDGFSAFEEYRGFYVNTHVDQKQPRKEHVRLDSLIRNVIFFDRMNDKDSRAAIQMFKSATLADRTYVVLQREGLIDDSRVMNVNRGSGPTQGDQHAVEINLLGSDAQIWRPIATGNRPSNGQVVVPGFGLFAHRAPKLNDRRDLYRRSIAQALLGTCGIPRPGTGDQDYRLTIVRGADGGPEVRTSTGEQVTLRNESGHDVGEEWLRQVEHEASVRRRLKNLGGDKLAKPLNSARRKYYVAHQGGEHSGPLHNIMRDTFAEAYRVANTIILLPAGHKETVGDRLPITSQTDAEPNRYGDSPNPAPSNEFTSNDHH
jgi:hypothetical protein